MLETAFTHRLVTPTAITRAARGARLALVFALLMAMLIFPPPRVVHAATITVTKLADENDHSCTDGDCSLRDAIETAAPNDTITFGVTGTIILTLGQLEINKHLTISGPGAAKLTISGDNASRVFHIASGNVTISGVTITKGYDAGVDGAGIYNEGTLTVSNCIFSGNLADDDGAAIRSEGALTVRGSTFSGNQAGNDGGSISFFSGDSRLTVTDSTFSGNTAGNNGGGISAVWASSLTVTGSTFSNNQAGNDGGAIDGSAPLTVTDSLFSGNQAGNDGGGISAWDLTTVTDNTFTDNTAGNYGGGMYARWYSAVTDSTFSGNQAGEGGGLSNGGFLVISNATFSGNRAADAGGGIGNNWSLAASNCTLSGNRADAGGGGLYSPVIFTATITNTIVANNAGGNCLGVIANGGHNIDSGATCNWGAAKSSKSNTNPRLLALANNGGDTATMALQAGSPAINQGSNAGCPRTDQRGAARPEGAACDIGAYEYGATPTLTAITPDSAVVGSPTLTLTLAGANFIAGAVAGWGGPPGAALVTTFMSATRLLAQVPASRLTAAGTHTITVRNPGPGDGTSGARLFTVKSEKVHLPVIQRQ